jgi:hypothetical protein
MSVQLVEVPGDPTVLFVEGHAETRADVLAAVRARLADGGVDEWDLDVAVGRVRVERTWYGEEVGFAYDGCPGARAVILIAGLPAPAQPTGEV